MRIAKEYLKVVLNPWKEGRGKESMKIINVP